MTVKNKFPISVQNTRGQGLIEALALAMALIGFLGVFLGTLYFSAVHVGMNYLLHEYLVCQQTQGNAGCKNEFLKKSKVFLLWARLQKFETTKSGPLYKVQLEIEMPFKRRMKLKKELALYR